MRAWWKIVEIKRTHMQLYKYSPALVHLLGFTDYALGIFMIHADV